MLRADPRTAFDAVDRGDQPVRPLRDKASIRRPQIASGQFPQTAVLILGMHRSGTSLLSSLVQALGISVGDHLIPGDMHNPAGYFEDRQCVDIQERMLEALGQPWAGDKGMLPFPARWWHDPAIRPLVDELELWIDDRRLSAESIWSLKDPRTTRFLPLWQELLQRRGITPRYLLAVRDPAEVVASEVKRDEVPAERVYRTWLRYNMEALLHAGADLAGVFVFDQWFTDGVVQLRRLAAILDVSVNDDECDAIIGQLVRDELHRQHGYVASPPIWASHLYGRLQNLSDQFNIHDAQGLAAEAEYFDSLLRRGEDAGVEGALTAVLPTVNGLPEALKLAHRLRAEGARVVLGVTAEEPAIAASGVAVVVRDIAGPTIVGEGQSRAAYVLWRWLKQRKYAAVHIEGGEGLAVHCLDARRQGLPDEHGPICVDYFARPAWLEEGGRLHLHSFAEAEALCLERRVISNGGCHLAAHPTLLAMLRHVAVDESGYSSSSIPSSHEPLVSVCITHHNRPEMLSDCLASVRAQTYRNLEVILVDDGSTLPAARVFVDSLEQEFQAKGWTLIRQENRYLGAARNTAIHAAKGDYLFFLDDDNLLMPDGVGQAVRVAKHTNADIVTAVMAMFHGPAGTDPTWPDNLQVFPGGAPLLGLFGNTLGDGNALIRRSCLEELEGFTEDRDVGAEDWEFFAKAALRGYRIEHSLMPVSWHRVSATGMVRSDNWWSDYRRALRAYEAVLPPALRELPALAGVLRQHANEAEARSQSLTAELAQRGVEANQLRAEAARRGGEAEQLRAESARLSSEAERLRIEAARAEQVTAGFRAQADRVAELAATLANVQAELDSVLASTSWRATWPVRVMMQHLPCWLRRAARGGAKIGWWTVTMKLPRKLRERQAAVAEVSGISCGVGLKVAKEPDHAPPVRKSVE